MKRGTPDHPKTRLLSNLLNIPQCMAVGILECLWHFAAKYTPQGNVGKYSNQQIADELYWYNCQGKSVINCRESSHDKCAEKLIEALIESGWIEAHSEYRLIIHDWEDHAEYTVKKYLKRNNLEFILSESGHGRKKSASREGLARGKGNGYIESIDNTKLQTFLKAEKAEVGLEVNVQMSDEIKVTGEPSKEILTRAELLHQAEEIWKEYPRKVHKQDSLPLIIAGIKEDGFEVVLQGVICYKESSEVKKGFVENADRWFRGKCWNDDPKSRNIEKSGGNGNGNPSPDKPKGRMSGNEEANAHRFADWDEQQARQDESIKRQTLQLWKERYPCYDLPEEFILANSPEMTVHHVRGTLELYLKEKGILSQ